MLGVAVVAAALAASVRGASAQETEAPAEPSAPAEAASAPVPAPRHAERVELETSDGWTLVGDYWPALEGRPTFMLVHSQGARRQEWEPLRKALFANGYGALSFDARGHGESLRVSGSTQSWKQFKREGQDNDWNRWSGDLDAAARFLEERGVASSSIAVAGALVGANVALKWAAVHSQTPLAVLLSPGINHKDVLSVGAMRAFGPRPVLIAASEDDRHLLLAGKVLFDNARFHGGEAYATFWVLPKGQGTEVLTPETVDRVLDWIASPLRLVELSTEAAPGGSIEVPSPSAGTPPSLLPLDDEGVR